MKVSSLKHAGISSSSQSRSTAHAKSKNRHVKMIMKFLLTRSTYNGLPFYFKIDLFLVTLRGGMSEMRL